MCDKKRANNGGLGRAYFYLSSISNLKCEGLTFEMYEIYEISDVNRSDLIGSKISIATFASIFGFCHPDTFRGPLSILQVVPHVALIHRQSHTSTLEFFECLRHEESIAAT